KAAPTPPVRSVAIGGEPSAIAYALALRLCVAPTGALRAVLAIVASVLLALGSAACSSGSAKTATPVGAAPGRPTALTVDVLAAPLGLDPSDVAFAWHVNDARRGAVQSAYRLVLSRFSVGGSRG